MVGAGTTFPDCMGSQIPNLFGSTNGKAPLDTGAVVNRPNGTGNFSGGLGEYVDDVRSWQTSEPAPDMTVAAIVAGAWQESIGGRTTSRVSGAGRDHPTFHAAGPAGEYLRPHCR
jgi:hypothetical protein